MAEGVPEVMYEGLPRYGPEYTVSDLNCEGWRYSPQYSKALQRARSMTPEQRVEAQKRFLEGFRFGVPTDPRDAQRTIRSLRGG